MSSPAGARRMETVGAAPQALQAASRAVQQASRAYEATMISEKSTQPPAKDLRSLDLVSWKRHSARSLFRLGDGRIFYTEWRDVARSRPSEPGGIEVRVAESAGGSTESLPVENLLTSSAKWGSELRSRR
eukprot:6161923-Pleurochrysis_carterae.AAC.2